MVCQHWWVGVGMVGVADVMVLGNHRLRAFLVHCRCGNCQIPCMWMWCLFARCCVPLGLRCCVGQVNVVACARGIDQVPQVQTSLDALDGLFNNLDSVDCVREKDCVCMCKQHNEQHNDRRGAKTCMKKSSAILPHTDSFICQSSQSATQQRACKPTLPSPNPRNPTRPHAGSQQLGWHPAAACCRAGSTGNYFQGEKRCGGKLV